MHPKSLKIIVTSDQSVSSSVLNIRIEYFCSISIGHIKILGRNLITYIRAWQNIVNRNALQTTGSVAFEFNTYIISLLVIFYLQLHQKLKTIDEIQSTVTNAQNHEDVRNDVANDMARFLDYLYDFFFMYGERYQKWNHVMSCHLGRWQERRTQPEQRAFTLNQKRYVIQKGKMKTNYFSVLSYSCCWYAGQNVSYVVFFFVTFCRLRDGIKQSETNWRNCYMFLQDLVRPNLNVTAEIPKEHAENFQEMCRLFAIQLRKNQS